MSLTLTVHTQPAVPLEADAIAPERFEGLSTAQISGTALQYGNQRANIGDFFKVEGVADSEVRVVGDVSRVKRIFAEKQEMLEKGQNQPKSQQTAASGSPSNNGPGWIRYLIKPGDTLENIAAEYGVSVDNLKNWNRLRPNRINAGESLDIYTEPEQRVRVIPTKPSQGAAKANGTSAASGKTHTVRQGQNLTEIAERYGIDVAALKSANGLSSSRIVAGQRLRSPSADRATNDFVTYRVRKGDSFWKQNADVKTATPKIPGSSKKTATPTGKTSTAKINSDPTEA